MSLSLCSKLYTVIMAQLSEQELVRREKLEKLRALGINPYPADLYPVTHTSSKIKGNYKEGEKVVIAGRLMRKKDARKSGIYGATR
jgi:lysyl-tRNA synthetase class 2